MKYDLNYQKHVEKAKNEEWRIKMHDIAKKFAKGHILELGCGVNNTFENSTKIDIVPLRLKNFIVADLNKKLPLKDNVFDSVVSLDVIEHLYDIDNFLHEINRVLKNRGVFILSTPNVLSWRNRLRFIFGKNFIFNEYKTTGHLIFFDYSS
ncbi:MAG: class I SAM-dependent methyltransferase, partial [Candidatus Anstonellales archaeon]